jgi:hypothetical protein
MNPAQELEKLRKAKRLAELEKKAQDPSVQGFVKEQGETLVNDVSRVGENLLKGTTPKRALGVAAEGITEGIAAITGLPMDTLKRVLNVPFDLGMTDEPLVNFDPTLSSPVIADEIRGVFRKFGIEPTEAELGNLTENLLQISGSAVAPTGVVLKGAKTAEDIGKANKVVSTIAKNPKEFVTGEAIASAGGAVGRTGAEQVFPDSPMAGMIGEIVGMPTSALIEASLTAGKKSVVAAKNNFGEEGAMNEAAKELQSIMTDSPEAAIKNLDNATDTPIAPAKLTNDPGLIQNQRELNAANAEIELENQRLVMENLTEKLESLNSGVDGSEFVRQARVDIENSINEIEDSVNTAVQKMNNELAELKGATRQDASRIARANLEQSYDTMHLKEGELWDNVDLDVPIKDSQGVENIDRVLNEIAAEGSTGREIPQDIVKLVDSFLYNRDFVKKTKTIKQDLTVKTLQNMRSRVLAEVRKSSSGANPDPNRSALLSRIQSALLDDMVNSPQTSPELTTAIAHSKKLNDTFNRGSIGKLRGVSSDGSLRVDPDLTLSTLISKGEKGGVNLRDFLDADSSPQTKQAVGEYVQQLFLADAVTDGVVDTKRAQNFLQNYSFVLEHLPQVTTKLNRAIKSGDAVSTINAEAKLSMKALEQSALKTFLNIEDPKRAIDLIRKSRTPSKNLSVMVEAANKDPSGNAIKGLRTLIADDIIKSLQTKKTVTGTNIKELSNAKAQDVLGGVYRKALADTGVFDDDQLTLIDEIVADLDKNQRTANAKLGGTSGTSQDVLPSKSEVLGKGGKLFALRFIAPMAGKGPGSLSAASTIGNMSQKVTERLGMRSTNDLIVRALTEDRELLKILLERVPTPKKEAEIVKKLRTHILSIEDREKERTGSLKPKKVGD